MSAENRELLLAMLPSFGIILGVAWAAHGILVLGNAAQGCASGGGCMGLPSLDAVIAGLHWRIDHILHFMVDAIMFLALWKILRKRPPK